MNTNNIKKSAANPKKHRRIINRIYLELEKRGILNLVNEDNEELFFILLTKKLGH